MYLYAPYRNQSNLPLFDTAEPDLNWIELFRTQPLCRPRPHQRREPGELRPDHAGVAAPAACASCRPPSGRPSTSLSRRCDCPMKRRIQARLSDLIAQVELAGYHDWNISTGMQWNPYADRTERAEVRHAVPARASQRREPRLPLPVRPPRTGRGFGGLAAHGRMACIRAPAVLAARKAVDRGLAGFEYSSCCWAVRAVARDYVKPSHRRP